MRWIVLGLTAVLLGAAPASAQGRQGTRDREGKLKVGDIAPDFSLSDPEGKQAIQLAAFRGKTPVVLVFASYT